MAKYEVRHDKIKQALWYANNLHRVLIVFYN